MPGNRKDTSQIRRIETHRIILREWKKSDITPLVQMNQDPKVMEYFASISTPAESEALFKRIQNHFEEKGFGILAAELKSTGEFIGMLGLTTVPSDFPCSPAIEIGWRLASSHWGKGYATEGAMSVLKLAFDQLKLDEVVSMTSIQNLPSRKVMQKIGMAHLESENFDHPKIEPSHPMCRQILYRVRRDSWHHP